MNKKYFAAAALACALMSSFGLRTDELWNRKEFGSSGRLYRGMEYCRSERRKSECGKCTILGL